MNKGLRFVSIKCTTVDDARRRGLAIALMTLDRKRSTFMKLFTKEQMKTSTFLSNINTWWQVGGVTKLGNDYLSKLLTAGEKQDALPVSTKGSHCGFILTKKDFNLVDSGSSQLPVTYVDREPKRINNEVKCLELRPSQYPNTMSTTTLNARPSQLIDSTYRKSEVLIEDRKASERHLDSSS